MGIHMFSFNGYCQAVFLRYANLHSPAVFESSDCSTFLSTLDIKAFYILAILVCVQQYHIVVLMFTSWMTNKIEHFSACLLDFQISFIEVSVQVFWLFFYWVASIFLIYLQEVFIYSEDMGPFLGICVNIFSLSVGGLSVLLMVFLDEHWFIFLKHISFYF